MKSFVLKETRRVSDLLLRAVCDYVFSDEINVSNEYMLFDDCFIRREHATDAEPRFIEVVDKYGCFIGRFELNCNFDIQQPCTWGINPESANRKVLEFLKNLSNPDDAKKFYRELMTQNSDIATYLRGLAAVEGIGTLKNALKASRDLSEGASAGHSASQVAYANLLQTGWFNQQSDPAEAIRYLESAICNENPIAKARLTELYLSNPSISNGVDKAVELMSSLSDSKMEIYPSDLERILARLYLKPNTPQFNRQKALDLYVRNGLVVDNKDLAIAIIDRKVVAQNQQDKYDRQAYEYIFNNSDNEFNDKCGEYLREALIARCARLGIGCERNLNRFNDPKVVYDPTNIGVWIDQQGTQTKLAFLRRYAENCLGKIELCKISVTENAGANSTYYSYGALLRYRDFLQEIVHRGYGSVRNEIYSLTAFIDSVSHELKQEYQKFVAQQQALELEIKQKEKLWFEQRKLEERIREEKEKARKEEERLERERQMAIEREERKKTHVWLLFRFTYYLPSDDFDDKGSTSSEFFIDELPKSVYHALLIGGEEAIKSFIRSNASDCGCYYRNEKIVAARMSVCEDFINKSD